MNMSVFRLLIAIFSFTQIYNSLSLSLSLSVLYFSSGRNYSDRNWNVNIFTVGELENKFHLSLSLSLSFSLHWVSNFYPNAQISESRRNNDLHMLIEWAVWQVQLNEI